MNNYRCDECGFDFEDPSFLREYHGTDDYEEIGVCPYCKGGCFEPLYECKVCGCLCTEDELNAGICDFCLYEYDNDIETCYAISKGFDETVGINSFLASIFNEDEINEILMSYARLTKKIEPISCREFIENDKEWFAERIKENNHGENYLR